MQICLTQLSNRSVANRHTWPQTHGHIYACKILISSGTADASLGNHYGIPNHQSLPMDNYSIFITVWITIMSFANPTTKICHLNPLQGTTYFQKSRINWNIDFISSQIWQLSFLFICLSSSSLPDTLSALGISMTSSVTQSMLILSSRPHKPSFCYLSSLILHQYVLILKPSHLRLSLDVKLGTHADRDQLMKQINKMVITIFATEIYWNLSWVTITQFLTTRQWHER